MSTKESKKESHCDTQLTDLKDQIESTMATILLPKDLETLST